MSSQISAAVPATPRPATSPPIFAMPALLDPELNMPSRLQDRLDAWEASPPKHQHQAYGPLSAYFHEKFPTDRFLVKPQMLVRKELAEAPSDDHDDLASEIGDISIDSIDSNGVAVEPNVSQADFPDFGVVQFWGADEDRNIHADVIRVVIEVASVDANQPADEIQPLQHAKIENQLERYMDTVGPSRWEKELLGVAICGSAVHMQRLSRQGNTRDVISENDLEEVDWVSLFDSKFVDALDRVLRICQRKETQISGNQLTVSALN